MKKGTAIFLAIILIALLLAGVFYSVQKEQAPSAGISATADIAPAQEQPLPAPPAAEATAPVVPPAATTTEPAAAPATALTPEADRILGSDTAPVTIIEYASLSCSHCAHFANDVLPEVKKNLIETGKARLIFRDFPFDEIALRAAMMARCADPAQYFDLIEVLFKNQERWARAKEPLPALKQYGILAGMNEETIDACFANKALETAILQRMQDGQKTFDVQATPTFIFNNGAEKFSGAEDPEKFKTIVEKLSSQARSTP